MRPILLVLCMLSLKAYAVDFTSLSRKSPVTLVHAAEMTAYVDISLQLDLEKASAKQLYLRIRYIIGNDTLHDNLTVTGSHSGVVKQLLMREGERLTAQVLLHNAETETVEGVQGIFRLLTNTTLKVGSDIGMSAFVGNVWLREQNPLFRVKFDQTGARNVQLVFHLDGNYEFDALHYKIKVISPEQGILLLPRTAVVTEDPVQSDRARTLRLLVDGVNFSYAGSYYIQVMHAMLPDRVNGVEKVSYEVSEQ